MSKTILLTGATDGIGLVTAQKLVELGHTVLIHGRNVEKLKRTLDTLQNIGKGKVVSYCADLSDLLHVRNLAEEILKDHLTLDVIINNAGIYKTPTPITKDNYDIRFVVNTIAPYFLTKQLLPILDKNGRVVNLSSAAQQPVDLNALAGKVHPSEDFSAYAQSKLAITIWTNHLANSLGHAGPSIIAVNPGSLLASKMVKEGFGVAGNDINIGADILIKAALSESFADASGKYFDNDAGKFNSPHADALDMQKCNAVVQKIEELIN